MNKEIVRRVKVVVFVNDVNADSFLRLGFWLDVTNHSDKVDDIADFVGK